MKKFNQLLTAFVLFLLVTTAIHAQQTIAFVETESVITNMADYKAAQSNIEAYGKQLQKQLEVKEKEMQDYYAETMQKVQAGTLSPAQQKDAEKKLTQMQQDLQKDAAAADKKLLEKENELTEPIYEKFNQALQTVASENNYTYILDKKLILHTNGGIDATAKVKAKLGL